MTPSLFPRFFTKKEKKDADVHTLTVRLVTSEAHASVAMTSFCLDWKTKRGFKLLNQGT